MRRRSIGLVASLLAACGGTGAPPWGFGDAASQRFVFEAEGQTEVDSAPVTVRWYADVELQAAQGGRGRTEISIRLERYYVRVDGTPGGGSELVLSLAGLVSRSPGQGEVRLGPDDPTPGGRTVAALLRQPAGGFVVGSTGELFGSPWRTKDPILADLPVIDWVLLALPETGGDRSWSARRPAPPLGQYRLGIDLPIRHERLEEDRILGAASVRRATIEIAEGFRGNLQIDERSEAELSASGQIREARVELDATFEAEGGDRIHSRYRVRLQRAPLEEDVNPSREGSDTRDE